MASTLQKTPEVIGLSVRNLDNNDMQAPVEFVTALTEITRTVQQLSTAPLILGGPAVGVMPESLLRRTQAACAVLGDGETVFPALLRALNHGGGFEGVPRLAWLDHGHYRTSRHRP